MLLITHDIYLAEACADRLWLVHAARVRPYDGDLEDYRDLVLSADRPSAKGAKAPIDAPASAAEKPKSSPFTLKQRVAAAEKILAETQAKLAALDAQLSDPDLFARDPIGAAAIAKEREAAASRLAEAEDAWLAASAALEG